MSSTKNALLTKVASIIKSSESKTTIVGVGQVGMAVAFSILTQGVSNDVVLVDVAGDKVAGETKDLQHGQLFLKNAKINGSTNYAATAGSRLCIVTAGVRQREGETRLDLVQRNTDVLKHIIPQLVKYSPETTLMIVSNPVDILTYVAWKLSGLPHNRVFGSGTNLDTSRFRFLLSQRLDIAPSSVHGWIIGEHGDTSVAVWSGVNVAGVRLRDINKSVGTKDDPEKFSELHEQVISAAYDIIKLKGYTNWAIGLSAASMADTILRNNFQVHCVSVFAKGYHGIEQDAFLSLPAVLGLNGVCKVVVQTLDDSEKARLQKSAALMHEVQNGIKL